MLGVIDIGSNTIRLSFYQFRDNRVIHLMNKKEVAGLAGYVKKNRTLSGRGIRKLVHVLKDYSAILEKVDVREVFVFATASLRNVTNSKEILKEIREKCNMEVDILSGADEAKYGYMGAIQCENIERGLLIDIGGGSTEMVFYDRGEILKSISLSIGSLSMYKEHVADILPTKKEMRKIRDHADDQVAKIFEPKLTIYSKKICAIGGTGRNVCKLYNEIFEINDDNATFKCGVLKQMMKMVVEDRKTFVDGIIKVSPERIHTIVPGMLILHTIAGYFDSEIVNACNYGVREGYIFDKLVRRGNINEQNVYAE